MKPNETCRKTTGARSLCTSGVATQAACLLTLAALSLGCASYKSTARTVQPSVVAQEGTWTMVPRFPLVFQAANADCGAAALAAVLRYWGYPVTPASLEAALGKNESRLRAGDMETYARSLGLKSYVFFGTMKDIVHELEHGRPVIVGLGKQIEAKKALSHYEVVVGYEPKKRLLLLLDPGRGWQTDGLEAFGKEWALSKGITIVAFLPAQDRRVSEQAR